MGEVATLFLNFAFTIRDGFFLDSRPNNNWNADGRGREECAAKEEMSNEPTDATWVRMIGPTVSIGRCVLLSPG